MAKGNKKEIACLKIGGPSPKTAHNPGISQGLSKICLRKPCQEAHASIERWTISMAQKMNEF
jgi:hypothetical protein